MSSKALTGLIVAAAAVFGGVWYFSGGSRDEDAAKSRPPGATTQTAEVAPAPVPATSIAIVPTDPKGRPVPTDPRLAALMVSPENALIEYVKGPDGRVIQELDNDPGSPRFRKPVREYLYAGAQVAGLTTYRNVGGQVEIVRVSVSYKDDGSVDQYRESIEHEKLVKSGN